MSISRITDRDDWVDIWVKYKENTLFTMTSNMISDLKNNNYGYSGKSIVEQIKAIEDYKKDIDSTLAMFKTMDEKEVNRWCFYDLKKRGAIY